MSDKQKRDRYEMHKYWGKKPSNDLKTLIEKYSKRGDTILDPFSGYGVFCCEAYILGRNIITNDLNPIANLINRQLLNREVNFTKLDTEWNLIKKEFAPFVKEWYQFDTGKEIVELVNILRNKEDKPLRGRFKSKIDKKIKEIEFTEYQANSFLKYEIDAKIDDWFPKNDLIENSRISAKKGMTVADLFTKRTLSCHAKLLSLIERNSSGDELELFRLAFTANLANCSKLVPPINSKGEMAQGAWMTGFYIGSTYLENNVLHYFENRLEKVIKGKKDYLTFFNNSLFANDGGKYDVTQYDAKKLGIASNSIDYVFTDPPYGDAVPYFEQSMIWNAWLRFIPDYENEIVISDSKLRSKNFSTFEKDVNQAFSEIGRVLKLGGYFSLTYHSLSGLEWKAITNACLNNGFDMVEFNLLAQKSFTPRQINRSKSIKGDVLITFKKAESINLKRMGDNDVKKFFIKTIETWLKKGAMDTNEIFLKIMEMIFSEKMLIENIDLLDILNINFSFTDKNQWALHDKLELCTT